jgi:trk system potassium uptake protein TrkH
VHLAGLTLLFLAPGMAVSALVDMGAGGSEASALWTGALLVGVVGALAWRSTRIPERLTATDALATVAVTWVTASIGGAVPYVLADTFPTVDTALFVVLAVSVLPFLGIGGMDLMSAESPGPASDRLAPKVSETARRLWLVYGGFTLLSIVSLLAVGLSLYDAVVHAFTVVSTGGLSPYDASIGHFDSVAVESVIVVLMLIGGTSFALHWQAVTGHPGAYLRSPMFRGYLSVFVFGSVIITTLLVADGWGFAEGVRDGVFNVATLLTSTGYGTVDFTLWVPAAQLILLAIMVGGGMAGSTAGGMKLVRLRLAFGTAVRELRRFRYPSAVMPVRIGSSPTPETVVARSAGFVALFLLIVIAGTIALSLLGTDLVTSGSSAVSMMSNMGPGLGEAGPASNFLVFSRPARAVLMLLMFAGRLEIIPVLVVLAQLGRLVDEPRRAVRRWGPRCPPDRDRRGSEQVFAHGDRAEPVELEQLVDAVEHDPQVLLADGGVVGAPVEGDRIRHDRLVGPTLLDDAVDGRGPERHRVGDGVAHVPPPGLDGFGHGGLVSVPELTERAGVEAGVAGDQAERGDARGAFARGPVPARVAVVLAVVAPQRLGHEVARLPDADAGERRLDAGPAVVGRQPQAEPGDQRQLGGRRRGRAVDRDEVVA